MNYNQFGINDLDVSTLLYNRNRFVLVADAKEKNKIQYRNDGCSSYTRGDWLLFIE